jgi:phosphoribosylglycinamide formyltransferase-1
MFDEVMRRQRGQCSIEPGNSNAANATLRKLGDSIPQGRNPGWHHFAALSRKPFAGGGLKRQHRRFQIANPSRLAQFGKQRLMTDVNAIEGADRNRARRRIWGLWPGMGSGPAAYPLQAHRGWHQSRLAGGEHSVAGNRRKALNYRTCGCYHRFMRRIVVMISGRGSNLQAILRAASQEQWPHAVVGVIADREDAPGIAVAAQADIEVAVVPWRDYAERADFEQEVLRQLVRLQADIVVLAGFMRILEGPLVALYSGRLLNIHPSLLPAFPGLRTHRRALEAGALVHGATVHLVTSTLDHGPILAQSVVLVRAGDTPESLAARVLETEHQMLPRALRWLADGRIHQPRLPGVGRIEIEGVSARERLLILDH